MSKEKKVTAEDLEPFYDKFLEQMRKPLEQIKDEQFYNFLQKDEQGKTIKIGKNPCTRFAFEIRKRRMEQAKIEEQKRKERKKMSRSGSQDFRQSLNFEFPLMKPRFNFNAVGGLHNQKQEILKILSLGLNRKKLFSKINARPIRGILLQGPSGCGKSLLAEAVVGELIVPSDTTTEEEQNSFFQLKFSSDKEMKEQMPVLFYTVKPTDIQPQQNISASAKTVHSETRLKELFKQAQENSRMKPVIIFIDQLDVLFSSKKSSSSKEQDTKILSQLCNAFDAITKDIENDIFVIGATNKIEKIPKELRRSCRFSREISLGIPDRHGRGEILQCLLRNIAGSDDIDITDIAEQAEGYIGADLQGLVQETVKISVERFLSGETDLQTEFGEEQLQDAKVIQDDFYQAMKIVQPSLRREGFTTTATVKFDAIGGLQHVQEELKTAIIDAIKYSDLFEEYGHKPGSGIILYGPPGCGKTLLARAVAHEAMHAAFISVKGPELLNKYLGESESAVRSVFRRARESAPCIIFFDEIDALCPRRSDDSSNAAASRVVNQLLTEMDGVVERGQIFVIGATNRLELVDEAMLRPGRLDKKIEVPLPNEDGRRDILEKILNQINPELIDHSIDLQEIANMSETFSGADLGAIITEATEMAINKTKEIAEERSLRDIRELPIEYRGKINQEFLIKAFEKVKSSKVYR